uniref:Ig-like domain-containing protein n=1 Tax=Chelydra serpentina TaxID=8475 RepID=A0A8C3XQN4_CHESE
MTLTLLTKACFCLHSCISLGFSQHSYVTGGCLVLEGGKIAELQCEQNMNYDYMYWYQQHQGKGLHLIYYSYDTDNIEPGNISKRFTAIRPQTQLFQLKIASVKPEDSAVYFCASSLDTVFQKQYFGEGTKLTVLEDGVNITSPTVTIFPPSKQEIKEKGKATLVCLATKFYPDHIKLVWKVNDAEREDGVRTDEFSTWDETSKSYSLTSRLRLSTQEWFKSKNSFKCAVKFHLDEIQYTLHYRMKWKTIEVETKGKGDERERK